MPHKIFKHDQSPTQLKLNYNGLLVSLLMKRRGKQLPGARIAPLWHLHLSVYFEHIRELLERCNVANRWFPGQIHSISFVHPLCIVLQLCSLAVTVCYFCVQIKYKTEKFTDASANTFIFHNIFKYLPNHQSETNFFTLSQVYFWNYVKIP